MQIDSMLVLSPTRGVVMSSKLARILYGESDARVLSAQKKMFEMAGYVVVTAIGRKEIEEAVKHSDFGLVILGHTLTRDDRHHLPYMAKKVNAATRVLVLHASGKHPSVDLAVDSRDGERSVLAAVAALIAPREPRPALRVQAVAVPA
jgi:hypothetical protein